MTIPIRGAISAVLGVALVTGTFLELACSNLIRTLSMTFSGSWGLSAKLLELAYRQSRSLPTHCVC